MSEMRFRIAELEAENQELADENDRLVEEKAELEQQLSEVEGYPGNAAELQEQNLRLVWAVEIRERDLDSALKAIQRIYDICLGNANLDTISTTKIMGIVASFPSAVPNPDLLAEMKEGE